MFAWVWSQIVNWLALPVLLGVALLVLQRKAHRDYPYFLSYIILVECVGVARLFVFHFVQRAYLYTFWISDVLIAIFTFLVAYELFIRRLFPRFYEVRFYRYLFPIAGFIISGTAVPAALANSKASLLLAFIHGLEILRVTVLLFFVGLMTLMGRRWARYEFGIALGLGLQASAELIVSTNWTRSLLGNYQPKNLPLFAFDIACLVWLITFAKAERSAVPPTAPMSREVVQQAHSWEDALKGSLRAKKKNNSE